jgi:hypothetical protein
VAWRQAALLEPGLGGEAKKGRKEQWKGKERKKY